MDMGETPIHDMEVTMSTFTNRATLTYRGVTASSNTVTGEIIGVLTAEKSALSPDYSAGTGVTYVISLLNSGDTALTGVTVTDDLGADGGSAPLTYVPGSAVWFLDGVRQSSVTVSNNGGLVFSDITVPANGSSLIVYDTDVNAFAPLSQGSGIVNTAVVTGPGISGVEAGAEVPAAVSPALSVVKALSPLTVKENGTVTYTFTIENSGNIPADAEDCVILEDVFDPILSGVTAVLDGTELEETSGYTYDPLTGEFRTVSGVITVPAASYSRSGTGETVVVPGRTVLTVTGAVA